MDGGGDDRDGGMIAGLELKIRSGKTSSIKLITS